jgi:Protein of unknown function (DUF2857)
MPLEAHAIVAPADQLMLVALLVTLARDNAIAFPTAAPGRASEESLLKRLAQLSLTEIHRLAETGALKLVVHYDSAQVAWSLQAAARKHAEQALLQYFVRHGAPRALLRELFRVSRERIEAVRQDLRLVPRHGRPKLPHVREREAIVTAWSQLASVEADAPTRYHALHRRFPRYSIAALDAVLREVSPERANAPAPSGKHPTTPPVSAPTDHRRRAPASPKRTVVHRRAPR